MTLIKNSIIFLFELGYVSTRDRLKGSIFVQELCKGFNENWFIDDIGTIAGTVNKNIMEGYDQIQAPVFENQLGNFVYFNTGFINR